MKTRSPLLPYLAFLLPACNISKGTEHTLVQNVVELVGPRTCALVEGPYAVPSGATMDYIITDSDGADDMDVGIIADTDGCDFSRGHGVNLDIASVSSGTGSLPPNNYDFVVQCNNIFSSCYFGLSWSATY